MTTYDDCKKVVELLLERGDRDIILFGGGYSGKTYMTEELKCVMWLHKFVFGEGVYVMPISERALVHINTFDELVGIDRSYYLVDMDHINYHSGNKAIRNYRGEIKRWRIVDYSSKTKTELHALLNTISPQSREEFDVMNDTLGTEYRYPQTVEEWLTMEEEYIHKVSFGKMYELFIGEIYIPKEILKVVITFIYLKTIL